MCRYILNLVKRCKIGEKKAENNIYRRSELGMKKWMCRKGS